MRLMLDGVFEFWNAIDDDDKVLTSFFFSPRYV